jgi:hypothetical protein
MISYAREHVPQIAFWIEPIQFSRSNQAIKDGRALWLGLRRKWEHAGRRTAISGCHLERSIAQNTKAIPQKMSAEDELPRFPSGRKLAPQSSGRGRRCFSPLVEPRFATCNGRLGRFLMNAMMASGAYPWTIIPVSDRNAYVNALEKASVARTLFVLQIC